MVLSAMTQAATEWLHICNSMHKVGPAYVLRQSGTEKVRGYLIVRLDARKDVPLASQARFLNDHQAVAIFLAFELSDTL